MMYTTISTKRYLASANANPLTATYLRLALLKAPTEGEEMLEEEIKLALDFDKQKIRDALNLLIQNNDTIYPHMRRGRKNEAI